MATITLKLTKCANCGHVQNSEFVENISNELTFSNYNLFKSFNVQRCQNCGYVSNDLTIKRKDYPIIEELIENNYEFDVALLNNDKMYYALLDKEKDNEIIIQLLASIFNAKKRMLNFILTRNYNTKDAEKIFYINYVKDNLLDFSKQVLLLLKNETMFEVKDFNKDIIKVFKIELLSIVNKTNKAEELLKSLNIKDEKLLEYLESCIEVGGKLCSNL